MKRLFALAVAAVVFSATAPPAQAAPILWYNGNFNFFSGLANERLTAVSDAQVFENFVVPAGETWVVQGLFSNNLMNFTGVTQAAWEIRSGVSSGNGGTLLASGISAATQTTTGNSFFGLTEYTIEVDGLSVVLGPGTYWMNIRPIGFGSGRSFMSTTSGTGAIGTPPGNDGNSFFTSSFFGYNFAPTSVLFGTSTDFSGGIRGQVIPEPATLAMFGLMAAGVFGVRRRMKATA